MMVNKWFLLAAGSALLAGCSSHEEPPPPEPPQGKVRVEVKQRHGNEMDAPPSALSEQRHPAPETRSSRDAAPPEPPPSPNRSPHAPSASPGTHRACRCQSRKDTPTATACRTIRRSSVR